MIDKEIMELLQTKTKRTPQRIYQMIEAKRKEHGFAISKETAAYVVAGENGIDISDYLDEDELRKVREIIDSSVPTATRPRSPIKPTPDQITVSFEKGLKVQDPYLPKRLLEDAKRMANVYPVVYVFENSVRNLILSVMEAKFGKDWWNNRVGLKLKQKVKDRIEKEDKNRWHGKRGAHPIFYTDIDDLKSVVSSNWTEFQDIFPELQWITGKIDEIEMSRNVIAHNNPLEDRDITRLELNLQDWTAQLSRWADKHKKTTPSS